MAYIDRLIAEARESAENRGHRMRRFTRMQSEWLGKPLPRWQAESVCLECGATVHVDTHPAPNGIDIGGEAVAINCEPTLTAVHFEWNQVPQSIWELIRSRHGKRVSGYGPTRESVKYTVGYIQDGFGLVPDRDRYETRTRPVFPGERVRLTIDGFEIVRGDGEVMFNFKYA